MRMISREKAIQRGLSQFYVGKVCIRGHKAPRWVGSQSCIECHAIHSANRRNSAKGKAYQSSYYERVKAEHLEKIMVQSARRRAREAGLPFNIVADDIRKLFPEDGLCPALGIPLDFGGNNNEASPTLDRIRAKEGYVRGNIAVISMRANRMKNDCEDPGAFRRMANWMELALRARCREKTQSPTVNAVR